MKIIVVKDKCPQNHPCPAIDVCPVGALSQKGNNAPEVDATVCIGCGACTNICPTGALQLED